MSETPENTPTVEVSGRMLDVLDTITRQLLPREALTELGMSRSQFGANVRKLRERGVIRRLGSLPDDAQWSLEYPYEVTGVPVVYRQELPPKAQLRLTYPVDSQRDMTVPPVRHVRWGSWSVQGVPLLNLDGTSGRSASDRVPHLRAVVAADLANPRWVEVFLASTRVRWSETQTAGEGWDGPECRDMTLVIACAVGVEAVLNITTMHEGAQ